MQRLTALLAVLLFVLPLVGCLSAQQARTVNAIANGVACGVAAANETPCTPEAVLEALARDAAAQQQKVEAVAPQAAATNPILTEKLLEQMAANTSANAALAKALLDLATRTAPAASSAAPAASPAPSPSEAPSSAPPAPTPIPSVNAPGGSS